MARTTLRIQFGATLTELVVGLGLAAGTLGMAVPAVQDSIHSARLTAASNELLADIYLARAEALKRNRRVALCKSADGVQCSSDGGWEQGWMVFHDENNSGALDPDEERINHHGPLDPPLRLVGNQPVARYISYSPLGASKLTGGGFQAGTLTLCRRSAVPTPSRQLVLNAVGRPRIHKATAADCA